VAVAKNGVMMDKMQERRLPIFNLIGIFFGGLWAAGGSMVFSGAIRNGLLLSAVIITIGLGMRLILSRRSSGAENVRFKHAPYSIAVLLEALGIAAIVMLAPRYGCERYVMQAIGILVGLHFIGLWKATQLTQFLWIAACICVISGLSMLFQGTTNSVREGDILTGFGNALVLWWGAGFARR
jgi:hypothetical protein